MLQGATESIVCLSPSMEVMAFNEALRLNFLDLYQRCIQIGDDYHQYLLPGTELRFQELFQTALKGERVSYRDRVLIWNRNVWYESHLVPFVGDDDCVSAVTITFRDVDLERQSIKKADRLATTLEAIFENTKDAIILLDTEFKIINCNTRAQHNFKVASNKVLQIGDDLRPFIFKGLEKEFLERFHMAIEGKSSVIEVAAQSFEGETFWFQTKFNPVYTGRDVLLGVSLFARPITDKKKAEMALLENEERFRKVIHSSPLAIFILDDESNWLEINPQVKKAYGYTLENLQGRPLSSLFPHHADILTEFAQEPFQEGQEPKVFAGKEAFVLCSFDQIWFPVEVNLSAFQLNQKKHWVMVVQDISKREADARLISEQYQKLSKIAWKQSHIIRSSVTKIAGIVHILEQDKEMSDTECRMWLSVLRESTNELDSYVQEIIQWAE